ncbi:MAG: membrane dipeptidase [Lachnospiraceae bacterium]|nr:membrane dipeptidase [Lachnospiraceae bacterium]
MCVADMHCDTISAIYERQKQGKHTELFKNDLQLDLQKMQKSHYLVQNFAIFVDLSNRENPYECYKNQLKVFRKEMQKNEKMIRPVKTYQDIMDNQKANRMSALLTVEEGEICQGQVERLEEIYADGVRMMTFTWNYNNSLGTAAVEGQGLYGLTETGIAFLEKMESLGIIPDVSHLSPEGFYDVYTYSKKPFVASHSDAFALCGHKRNLSDDMVRKIAEKGGVIGINYYGPFLENESENGIFFSRVSRIAEHILHYIQVGGIACVGLGSDFDGMDDNLELKDCSRMEILYEELKKQGLTEKDIEAVFYQNVCNLYKELL